jgi:hypothetical protein
VHARSLLCCNALLKHTYNTQRNTGRRLSRQTLTLKKTPAALTWISDLTRESPDLEHKRQPSTAAQAEVHTAESSWLSALGQPTRTEHSTPRARPNTVPGQATTAPGYQPGYHQGPCPLAYNGKKGAAKLATGRSPLGRTGCIITLITGICWPGWLGQASWVPGKQHRPTGAREQRTSPALALATGPSLARQAYSMVQRAACAYVRAVPSGSRVTQPPTWHMPMRLCCMSHTRQHASNTNNRPSLASTNNGEFGLSCTMSHEHG